MVSQERRVKVSTTVSAVSAASAAVRLSNRGALVYLARNGIESGSS